VTWMESFAPIPVLRGPLGNGLHGRQLYHDVSDTAQGPSFVKIAAEVLVFDNLEERVYSRLSDSYSEDVPVWDG
jgi:hypothetical protein